MIDRLKSLGHFIIILMIGSTEMSALPKRKPNRLSGYDYAQIGAYHIILCTENRAKILSEIAVASDAASPPQLRLSEAGRIVFDSVMQIPLHYPQVSVDHFVIMPNHVHLLISIHSSKDGQLIFAPSVSTVVKQMKTSVTKRLGRKIWQKGFYDHIIKDDADYESVWTYIDENPRKWENDAYY